QPLPSVLPSTAMTRVGSICPDSMARSRAETSSGAAAVSRVTRVFMVLLPYPNCCGASRQLEGDVLRTFPEGLEPKCAQVFTALDDGQKVISSQLPQLAGEAAGTVGHDDFRLAVPAGVEQNVAHRRMAGVILEAHRRASVVQLIVPHGHPAAFAAPAHVDELLAVGQQRQERRQGV